VEGAGFRFVTPREAKAPAPDCPGGGGRVTGGSRGVSPKELRSRGTQLLVVRGDRRGISFQGKKAVPIPCGAKSTPAERLKPDGAQGGIGGDAEIQGPGEERSRRLVFTHSEGKKFSEPVVFTQSNSSAET